MATIKYECCFEGNKFTRCEHIGNDIDPVYVGSTMCHRCRYFVHDDMVKNIVECNHP